MKFTSIVIITFLLFNFSLTAQEKVDNLVLKKLYQADQKDRQIGNLDWSTISKNDSIREARVYELLNSQQITTSQDYYNAAMIFQHGNDTIASGMAVKMMRKSIELDSSQNNWLFAAAIDRDLMRRKEAQIYGTQFTKKGNNEPWQLYLIDSTQISDAERKEFGVETLAQQRAKVIRMNKNKLHELLEQGKTVNEIVAFIKSEDLGNSKYDLSESGINRFGYQLMEEGDDDGALKVLETNAAIYPDAFNTHDSLGEIFMKLNRKDEGLKAYEKSFQLNPENKNAEIILLEFGK